jgi:hypothetical protein
VFLCADHWHVVPAQDGEERLRGVWETWAMTQGLDPNDDVAYHYAKAGWDAALRLSAALEAHPREENP